MLSRTPTLIARLAAPALTFLVSCLVTRAEAHERLYRVVDPAPSIAFGSFLVLAPDVDGDGVDDVLTPSFSASTAQLCWISARTGAIARRITVATGFSAAAVIDDLDGDGERDVVLAASPNVLAVSSVSGATLWTAPNAITLQVATLLVIDDVDADGFSDLVVGSPNGSLTQTSSIVGRGRVEVRSGRTGALVSTFAPDPGFGLGGSSCALGDFDGDGTRDFAVSPYFEYARRVGPASGSVRVYSGATLAEIFVLPPQPLGSRVSRIGDFDADGHEDLLVTVPIVAVRIHSGLNGAILREWPIPDPSNGTFAVAAGDLDGDGVTDVAVATPQYPVSGHWTLGFDPGPGYVRVFSGATGATIWTLTGSDTNADFGAALVVHPDAQGDLVPDVCVTSTILSRVEMFSGVERYTRPQRFCVTESGNSIDWSGHPTYTANDFVLRTTNFTVPSTAATYIYSRAPDIYQRTGIALTRCLAAPIIRFGPQAPLALGAVATRAVDLFAPPFSAGPGAITPGTTVYFQLVQRVGSGSPPQTLPGNDLLMSDVLAVTFAP